MSAVVELRGVGVRHGPVVALEGVDLTVEAGDFLAVIGPNGSGKRTLLRVMLGLLTPDSGEVRLFGVPPAAFREWARLGYVPQRASFDPTLPATAAEVVASGLVARLGRLGRLGVPERARVEDALERVGMLDRSQTRMATLSAGQQQRVLIARALVCGPELLVLDEPTEGVDADAQAAFHGLLRRLNRAQGVTLILVTHDVAAVSRDVTKLACLNRRLVYHGPPADALHDGPLAALYGPSVRLVSHEHR